MTIGKRIRERRVACGLSVSDLAKQLGKNRSTVYRYESDEIENLPTDILEPIAAALHTSPAYLMGWTEDPVKEEKVMPSNLVRLDTVKYIPLVGEIACGTPILAQENIVEKVLLPSHVDATFALECHGDSMIGAGIEAGDVVFIREQPEVETGEIAAIMIEDCATLKKVYYDKMKSKLTLMPMNPSFDPFVYVGEEIRNIRIIGKAVAILKNLE